MGASHTQNRKKRQHERGWFGKRVMHFQSQRNITSRYRYQFGVTPRQTLLKFAGTDGTFSKLATGHQPRQIRSADRADYPRRRWRRSSPGRGCLSCPPIASAAWMMCLGREKSLPALTCVVPIGTRR